MVFVNLGYRESVYVRFIEKWNRPLGIPRRRWEDNIKIGFKWDGSGMRLSGLRQG